MVELFALTGGVVAAGIGLYRYFAQSTDVPQPEMIAVESSPSPQPVAAQMGTMPATQMQAVKPTKNEEIDLLPRTEETKAELQRGLAASSISLGIASTSLLFFPPLRFATVPILLYMGAPSAQRASTLLYQEGRPSMALAETTALAICLGGSWYLLGSMGFGLYYLGRLARHNRSVVQKLNGITAPPQNARRIDDVNGADVMVPTAILDVGDEVVVRTSEVVPVSGIVTDGTAWIKPVGSTDAATYCLKRTGDRVCATDIILVGQLSLRVQKKTI